MNHAMLQRIVEEVAARLRHRALSTATLSVAQLGELVLLCSGSSARHVFSGPNEAIDLAVVGIVDSLSR